jgi:hypothetical protein
MFCSAQLPSFVHSLSAVVRDTGAVYGIEPVGLLRIYSITGSSACLHNDRALLYQMLTRNARCVGGISLPAGGLRRTNKAVPPRSARPGI